MSNSVEHVVSEHVSTRGGHRQLPIRIAEAFFRRWPLFVLPVVLLGALGVYQALQLPKQYRSVGKLNVESDTLLSDLTTIKTQDFGYETPSAKTARNISELMTTDSFLEKVAAAAGLTSAVQNGQITYDKIRQSVSVSSSGDSLLAVAGTSDNPEFAQKVATAVISSYRDYVLSSETTDNNSAITFFQSQINDLQTKLDTASQAVDDYLTAHPAPSIGDRPDSQTRDLNRLTAAETAAQEAVTSAQGKLEEAQLANEQSKADIDQRLQIVDAAQVPDAPLPQKLDMLMTFVIYAGGGLVIAVVALILVGMSDKTVRTSADMERLGLRVVATIPKKRGPLTPSPRRALAAGADAGAS